jgi:hypothetical protein
MSIIEMAKLFNITSPFQLGDLGFVSFIFYHTRKRAKQDLLFKHQIGRLIKSIVNQAT